MRKNLTKPELKSKLEDMIKRLTSVVENFSDSNNPQVKELRENYAGKLSATQAIYNAYFLKDKFEINFMYDLLKNLSSE